MWANTSVPVEAEAEISRESPTIVHFAIELFVKLSEEVKNKNKQTNSTHHIET